MNYTEFVTLIGQNTSHRLVDYKRLCRFCLKDQSDGIYISDDNSNTKIRRDMIYENYVAITKQHVSEFDIFHWELVKQLQEFLNFSFLVVHSC